MTAGGVLNYNGILDSCNNLGGRHMPSYNIVKVEY